MLHDTQVVYKGIAYTSNDIYQMRCWIDDCQWADLTDGDANDLSDIEVLKGIDRNYVGGLKEFMITINA